MQVPAISVPRAVFGFNISGIFQISHSCAFGVLDLVGLSSASDRKQLTCAIYKNLRATPTKRGKLREVQRAITPIPTFALSGSSLRCTQPRQFAVVTPLQPRFHELLSSQASSWMVKYHSASKKLHFSYTKIVYDLKISHLLSRFQEL